MTVNFRIGDLVRPTTGVVGMRGLQHIREGEWVTAPEAYAIENEVLVCIGISNSTINKHVLHLLSSKSTRIVHYYAYEVTAL